MNLLFVSSTRQLANPYLDQSVRYRCYNIAEVLTKTRQANVHIVSLSRLRLKSLKHYDVVVFHRPIAARIIHRAIAELDSLGILRVADYDDLIFDPAQASGSPLFVNGFRSLPETRDYFERNRRVFSTFRYFTVSTEPLRERVLALQPDADCRVIRNALSAHWLSQLHDADADASKFVMGYFSGSHSHDKDFLSVSSVLAEHMHTHRNAYLLLVGQLGIDEARFPRNRTVRFGRVRYGQLPQLLGRCSVTLGPLVDGAFNACKSGIKFLESGALGVPFIGSRIEDIARHACSDAVLADSTEQWSDKLEQLSDSHTRAALGESLQAHVLDTCLADATTRTFSEAIHAWAVR
ncbi:MAG TPA: hypothetical protein DD979_05060 [Gammaproteobacteria bacterium]|jgi:hypothetical protein|nr:hypothetical protein [Gammaproteobacteria bacterium]